MRSVSLFLVLLVAAAPAAAIDRDLGISVQTNIAAMTVDLTPAYANVPMEGTNGRLGDSAVSRYRAGQVKPLLPLSGKSDLGVAAATGTTAQARGSDGVGASRTNGPN
jgi:hypothetical protein